MLDRVQRVDGVIDGDGRRPAPAGEADAVADEEDAIAAGDIRQVEASGRAAAAARITSAACR